MSPVVPSVQFHRFRVAGNITVECAQFVLSPGTTEQDLVRASTRMRAELAAVPGFLGQFLVTSGSGYLDMLYWKQDSAGAPRMEDRAARSAACADYLACMAPVPNDGIGAGTVNFPDSTLSGGMA